MISQLNDDGSIGSGARVARRDAIKWAAGIGAVAMFGGAPLTDARAAEVPASAPQGAGFYRFKVGDIDAAIVSDGSFELPNPQGTFAANVAPEEPTRLLEQAFFPTDRFLAHVNPLLLRRGKDVVLVDAGAGGLFGPTSGKLLANLKRLGVTPADVTAVVITHLHGDHVGGLLDAAGKPVFPNAQHFAHETELAFWGEPNPDLSRSYAPPELRKMMVDIARNTLAGLKGKVEPFRGGKQVVSGVEVVDAPGHTPGHAALAIGSGKAQMLYLTDATHHVALNFKHPEWHVAFDADPVIGAKTRKALLDRAASDRTLISSAHLPFPAVGHVRTRTGEGFEWVPEVWRWTE